MAAIQNNAVERYGKLNRYTTDKQNLANPESQEYVRSFSRHFLAALYECENFVIANQVSIGLRHTITNRFENPDLYGKNVQNIKNWSRGLVMLSCDYRQWIRY